MKPLVNQNLQINLNEQANKINNKIPNYEDKNLFQKNFFGKNRLEHEHHNFQQHFYLNDMLQIQKNQMIENIKQECQENSNVQREESIQEKIINYIIEYQQQNINKKYTYVKKRIAEEQLEIQKKMLKEKMLEIQNTNIVLEYKEELSSSNSDSVCKQVQVQQQPYENNIIQNFILGFENFYKGESSQILLQDYEISAEKMIIYFNKALKQFNQQNINKKKEEFKISYIGISKEFNFQSLLEEKDFEFLQSFSFMIQNKQQSEYTFKQNTNDLIQKDQYCLKLNISNKITNQINLLYRYFLKNKIRQFKPKIIVLFLEINDSIDFETFYLQKLITQLDKLSQYSLIIIPLLTQNTPENYEKYLKYTVLITNSCLNYSYKRKNKAYYQCEDMSAQQYKEYSDYFAQTLKEQQYYARQFIALKVRKNQYQSNKMELEYEKENFIQPYQISQQNEKQKNNKDQEFQFNLIGILNQKNQIVLTKVFKDYSKEPIKILGAQHFIQYNSDQNQFIICIVQEDQLFYKICEYNLESETQIDDSIYLDQYSYFKVLKQNCKSSYLLLDSYFYQFNVQIDQSNNNKIKKNNNSGFQYFVQLEKYNLNEKQQPEKYYNQEDNQKITCSLINFTITQLQNNKFILLGGTFQSTVQDYNFNLRSCSLMIEIDEKNQNKLKVTENVGKLKSYEHSITQRIDNYSLLYFEAYTKYLTAPIQSQIQRLSVFGAQNSLKLENCQILNSENFEFYQKKKKLFKSNQLNTKIISQNKNKLSFLVIIQELVQDNIQILDQEDSINLRILSKQVQLQVHKFYFTYDFFKSTIDIQIESSQFILEHIQKPNSLRESCLYVNWLEDKNNQYIFHYNGIQNLYLLYFHDKPSPKTRKFIFEDPKDKEDYIDYDEVILNDLENEQLWIVRKINYQDHISLDLFESDWINLQEVKDSQEDSITKVSISFLYTIASIKEDFSLIGLEVKWQLEEGKRCPYLIICTSTMIYEISIQIIRKVKWDNILRYKPNTWDKEPLSFQKSPIVKTNQVQINVNMQIPTIVASLENRDLLLFYSYCNLNKITENEYELEIQYQIIKNLNQQDQDKDQIELEDSKRGFQLKTIKYNSKKEICIAKINTVIIQNNEFEFSVIVEESDSKLYKIFSANNQQDQQQFITIMKECRILNDAAPLKNQSIIVSQNCEKIYHLK